jgi:ribosomal silencing factor RsfS
MPQNSGVAIEVRQARDFHDRFVVIDGQSCVHIGAFIKDAGKTAFMISRLEDQQNRDSLVASIEASWNGATVLL